MSHNDKSRAANFIGNEEVDSSILSGSTTSSAPWNVGLQPAMSHPICCLRTLSRRCAALAACLAFAGCSSVAGMLEATPPAEVARPTPAAIKKVAAAVAAEEKLDGPIEVSQVRASPISAPTPWMVCLRSAKDDASRRRGYALFFNGDTLKISGPSAVMYACESESFSPVK